MYVDFPGKQLDSIPAVLCGHPILNLAQHALEVAYISLGGVMIAARTREAVFAAALMCCKCCVRGRATVPGVDWKGFLQYECVYGGAEVSEQHLTKSQFGSSFWAHTQFSMK